MIHNTTVNSAEASQAAMARTFSAYKPRAAKHRTPHVLRMRDALILSLLALLVVARWYVFTPSVQHETVQTPR